MITSTSNIKVKNVANLLISAKARRESGTFVVEGERIVREIPNDRILECYVTESFERMLRQGEKSLGDVAYEVVSDQVFKKMSDTKSPQGVLCVVKKSDAVLDDFLNGRKDGGLKLLVLEGVQDPGNLGTMIRTAEGAGIDCVIADNATVDIYNPKVTRSTMGSLFRVPIFYVEDLQKVLSGLKDCGVKLCAAHLRGEADYCDVDYGSRVAILIGNEGNGLSDAVSNMSDLLVKIPMSGKVESLNAAVAAALMMYEVRKSK